MKSEEITAGVREIETFQYVHRYFRISIEIVWKWPDLFTDRTVSIKIENWIFINIVIFLLIIYTKGEQKKGKRKKCNYVRPWINDNQTQIHLSIQKSYTTFSNLNRNNLMWPNIFTDRATSMISQNEQFY